MNVEGVYEVGRTAYIVCWCQNDRHLPGYRSAAAVPGKPEMPHLIAVRSFELSWRVQS
jgi:hypothetical protein